MPRIRPLGAGYPIALPAVSEVCRISLITVMLLTGICDQQERIQVTGSTRHIYLHQVEKEKYSKEKIIKTYKEFMEEMYIVNKRV